LDYRKRRPRSGRQTQEITYVYRGRLHEPHSKSVSDTIRLLTERYPEASIPSKVATSTAEFSWLGLADTVWLEVADEDAEILTVDVMLYTAALKRGLSATNFNHLRERFGTV